MSSDIFQIWGGYLSWFGRVCVWQEGAGNVLFHGENAGQHAGRLWDENGEGGPGATKQA